MMGVIELLESVMSAKELFEGRDWILKDYTHRDTGNHTIVYEKEDGYDKRQIVFDGRFKAVVINEESPELTGSTRLWMEEIKAINRQLEELGWL